MNLEDLILETVRGEPLPVRASDVAKRVRARAGRAATPMVVATALESMAQAGALNQIAMSGKPPLFTHLSHGEAALALLRKCLLALAKELPAAKLKLKLPVGLQPHFEPALISMVAADEAFVLPGAKRLVFAGRPKPSALLDAPRRRALQKILDHVNAVRASPATLGDLIAWLDGDVAVLEEASSIASLAPDEADLRSWYEMDRVRSSTVMIPIPQTFVRFQEWAGQHGRIADSQVLRNLLEVLYNNGSILLEPCERPQDLPDHERDLLVPMSLGPPGYSWCWLS